MITDLQTFSFVELPCTAMELKKLSNIYPKIQTCDKDITVKSSQVEGMA